MSSTHVLLTGVGTGPLDLAADAVQLAALLDYLLGVRRLHVRGRPWPLGRSIAFTAGMAAVWVAVGSGLAAYDETSVTLHVVQHVVLMMVAGPLLALGRPVTLATQAATRRTQVRLVRIMRSRPVGAITHPAVAWALYLGGMAAYFVVRSAYDATIAHPLLHYASHGAFLAVGYLCWQPLVGGDANQHRCSHPARILTILVAMPFEAFIGVTLMVQTGPIDPINTVADTRGAGQVFIILSMAVSGVWLALLVLQWIAQLEREDARDRAIVDTVDASLAPGPGAAPSGPVPAGWTVAPWMATGPGAAGTTPE